MPRRKARGYRDGHIRQRADGLFGGTFEKGRDPITGKRRRGTVYGRTYREAEAKLEHAMADHARGLPTDLREQTVGQYLEHWLAQVAQPRVRPRTYESHCYLLRTHAIPVLGAIKLTRLGPQHIQGLLNGKRAAGRIPRSRAAQAAGQTAPLSPRTVQYLRTVLRTAFDQAVRWELIDRNPAGLVDAPKQERHEFTPWTPGEAQRFLVDVAARGDRYAALYRLVLRTGLRQGEALGLTWDALDLDGGRVRVRGTLQRLDGQWTVTPPKTERARRTLPLPPDVVDALREHRTRQKAERLAAGPAWPAGDWVFTTPQGEPLNGTTLTHAFHRAARAAGVPAIRFHDLRHTCATHLIAVGISPRAIMEQLGHSQISLTMNTDAHVGDDLLREAAERLARLYREG